jgi:transposase
MTQDLLSLHDWLQAAGCTHVALESTGVYWKPVFNLLQGDFEILVVNAQHIKAVPGRKTDVRDAEWIADLLQHGLLRGSYIPPTSQRELRELTRYRTKIIEERARAINRLQKTLEDTNLKLGDVVSDIMGKSARAMLEAMLSGQDDPVLLADLARGRLRLKRASLEQALVGTLQPHHRFLIAEHLTHIDLLDEAVGRVSQEIEQRMSNKETCVPEPVSSEEELEPASSPDEMRKNEPVLAEREGDLTWEEAVALLDTIPGINQRAAEDILAEVGLDMSRFPSAKHLASWAGLAPWQP